jgi:ABC-type uncharacterized transport system fused permease/ATPase subunit
LDGEEESGATMDTRDALELLSTLQELKAELRRQEASLRAQRNETLVNFAEDQNPAHQVTLEDLTVQIANVTKTLADLEVTIMEVER